MLFYGKVIKGHLKKQIWYQNLVYIGLYRVFYNLCNGAKNTVNIYLHFKQDICSEKVKEQYWKCGYVFYLFDSKLVMTFLKIY